MVKGVVPPPTMGVCEGVFPGFNCKAPVAALIEVPIIMELPAAEAFDKLDATGIAAVKAFGCGIRSAAEDGAPGGPAKLGGIPGGNMGGGGMLLPMPRKWWGSGGNPGGMGGGGSPGGSGGRGGWSPGGGGGGGGGGGRYSS